MTKRLTPPIIATANGGAAKKVKIKTMLFG